MDLDFHDLFEVKDNSSSTRGFAWAWCYRPVPGRKSFIHESLQARSDEFFRINPMEPGIHIDDVGSKWPDFLGCGGGHVPFFVSEKVVESLNEHHIEYADTTEYPIASILSKKLQKVPPPRYYVIEPIGELATDWKRMGIPTDPAGKPILTPLPKPWPPLFWSFHQNSWSGRDLVAKAGDSLGWYGSVRLGWIAKGDKWTNCRFEGAGRFPQHSKHKRPK